MKAHEARLLQLAAAHGGFSIGEENGKRGYMLTFVIAYIRVGALQWLIRTELLPVPPEDRKLASRETSRQDMV